MDEFLPQTFFRLGNRYKAIRHISKIYDPANIRVRHACVGKNPEVNIERRCRNLKKSSYKEMIVSAFLYMFQYMG